MTGLAGAWVLVLACKGQDQDTPLAESEWYDGELAISDELFECQGPNFRVSLWTEGWSGGVDLLLLPEEGQDERHPLALRARDEQGWWEHWYAEILGGRSEVVPGFETPQYCSWSSQTRYRAVVLDADSGEDVLCLEWLEGGTVDCED